MAARKPVKAPDKSKKDAGQDELAGPPPERVKCAGQTKAGKPCPRYALDGVRLCGSCLNRGRGRPTKLTDEVTQAIVEILARGGYAETAAVAAGISKATFYEWMGRGDPAGSKKVDEPYRVFRLKIEEARAQGESVRVQQVAAAAADGEWRAAAWMLEREFPDRWGGPRARNVSPAVHPDDFAAGEASAGSDVVDDQLGPDGRPL